MKNIATFFAAAVAIALGFKAGDKLGDLSSKGIDALVDKCAKKKENK